MTTTAPVFHIGYPKTATTFLQRQIFGQEAYGLALAGGTNSRAHLVDAFILSDGYEFDPQATAARLTALEQDQRAAGLLPIWSEEVLLGDPLANRYDGHANATRIAACFPKARILITIREQKAMVLSMYRQYSNQGGQAPLRHFIGTGQEPMSFSPILRDGFLLFDRAVRFYQTLFGKENILVLPQEMLNTAPQDYLHRLGAFLGRDLVPAPPPGRDNPGLGLPAVRLNTVLNRLVLRNPLTGHQNRIWTLKAKAVRGIDKITPSAMKARMETRFCNEIQARYGDSFGDSNRRLSEMTGLPLQRFGYF